MVLNIAHPISKDEITLQLFNESFSEELTRLAADPRIWELRSEAYYDPQVFKDKWIKKTLEHIQKNKRICFVVFYKNKMIGSSSFYDIDTENKILNIGYTWFHPDYWGTKINPLTKLAMLETVFENLKYNRAGFSVDSINTQSCKALEKLGIKHEGIMRNHIILSDGRVRHSSLYSVIVEEWPQTKKNIEAIVKSFR